MKQFILILLIVSSGLLIAEDDEFDFPNKVEIKKQESEIKKSKKDVRKSKIKLTPERYPPSKALNFKGKSTYDSSVVTKNSANIVLGAISKKKYKLIDNILSYYGIKYKAYKEESGTWGRKMQLYIAIPYDDNYQKAISVINAMNKNGNIR